MDAQHERQVRYVSQWSQDRKGSSAARAAILHSLLFVTAMPLRELLANGVLVCDAQDAGLPLPV